MKKVTYNGKTIRTVVLGDIEYDFRPEGSPVELPNDLAQKLEGQDDFTIQDVKTRKGSES